MSNTPFVESQSSDPVERALARKVIRILNDTTLDRQQRESLVRKVQRELIAHRNETELREALRQRVAATQLPKGYRAQSALVRDGRVQVSGLNRQKGLVWIDAGKAPMGSRGNNRPMQLASASKGGNRVRKTLEQSLAERRKALGYRQPSQQV